MKNTKLNLQDVRLRRQLNIFLAVCMSVLYALYRFALIPLYSMYANDVLYADGFLPIVMQALYEITDVLALSCGYAVTAYSIYRYGIKNSKPTYVIFSVITVLQLLTGYAISIAEAVDIGKVIDGRMTLADALETMSEAMRLSDIFTVSAPIVLMLLQYLCVVLICRKIISKYSTFIQRYTCRAKAYGEPVPERDFGIYPFFGGSSLASNPMIKISLWSAIVVLITGIVNMLPSLIIYSVLLEEFLWLMLVESTVMSVLLSLVCFFATVAFIMLFFEKKFKRELYEDAPQA